VGGRTTNTAHLVNHDIVSTLSELPRGFAAGEATADDVDDVRRGFAHDWKINETR
jgi:hypothetical protein